MTDKEFVKQHWVTPGVYSSGAGSWYAMNLYPGTERLGGCNLSSRKAAWKAAAEFTRQRLEEIRQVEQEIGITRILSLSLIGGDRSLLEGVIARLEAALSDLRKGMKN